MVPDNLTLEQLCNWMNDHGWWGMGILHPHEGRVYSHQAKWRVPDEWGVSFYDYTRDDGYHGVYQAQGFAPDLLSAAYQAARNAEKQGFHPTPGDKDA